MEDEEGLVNFSLDPLEDLCGNYIFILHENFVCSRRLIEMKQTLVVGKLSKVRQP